MADNGQLTDRHITLLADQLAAFHNRLEPLRDHGGRQAMARAITNVVRAAADRQVMETTRIRTLAAAWRDLLSACGPRLDSRRRHGHVRQCHGDLHLANICLVDGQPTPFDCIEFNDDLACIDTAYDLAFPVMDLMTHGREGLANLLLNRYLSVTQDYTALPLLRLFIAARALVRACVRAMEDDNACLRYLDTAAAVLKPPAPRLIAIGGRSGTGKSTLARHLAAPWGALWLRTDMIRKAMLGAAPEEKLPEEAYSPDATRRTYQRMARTALRALGAGWPVILDAVFLKAEERAEPARIARRAGVPYEGLWQEAPVALRAERVNNRRHDASDADARIARLQEDMEAGDIPWQRIDVSGELEDTVRQACAVLATGEGASS
jgi:predicted kinase